MLKPSELITHTNLLLAKLWPKYLDPDLYQVVLGDVPVSKEVELSVYSSFYTYVEL